MTGTPDPLTAAREARDQRKELTERIKHLDREAIQEGQRRGMSTEEIAVAIGTGVAHIYNIRRTLHQEGHQ